MKVLPKDATVSDFAIASLSGQTLKLSAALGNGPVFLVFGHPSINASRLVVGYLRRMAEIAPNAQVWVLLECSHSEASKYAGEGEAAYLKMPVAVDDGTVAEAFGVGFVPACYLVGAGGKVLRSYSGFNRDFLNTVANELAGATGAKAKELIADGDNKGFYELAERIPGR